jgi:hypothetical protein
MREAPPEISHAGTRFVPFLKTIFCGCIGCMLVLPHSARAMGEIVSVTIRPDGWSADLSITGMSTNGTFDFGLGPQNSVVGTQKVTFWVLSQGFDSNG